MKNKKCAVFTAGVGCLLFSGLAFSATAMPTSVDAAQTHEGRSVQAEQVTTNVLLRQILVELIKGNSPGGNKNCSDGEKQYSPGYVVTTGKKTLRCEFTDGYSMWREIRDVQK